MTLPIGTSYRLTHGRAPAPASPQESTCTCRAGVMCAACQAYTREHQALAPSAGQLAGRALSRKEVQLQLDIATGRLAAALEAVPVYKQRVEYWRNRVRRYVRCLEEWEGTG
jgi:hypothetical protein